MSSERKPPLYQVKSLPVVTMVLIPRCFDTSIAIWEVCSANSRVGTMIMPWECNWRSGKRARNKLISHLNYVLGGVDLLQAGNRVRSSLSGSVLCSRQNVPEIGFQGDIPTKSGSNSPSWEGDRNARFLDWAWLLPTFLKNTLESEAITYQSYCYMKMISCS